MASARTRLFLRFLLFISIWPGTTGFLGVRTGLRFYRVPDCLLDGIDCFQGIEALRGVRIWSDERHRPASPGTSPDPLLTRKSPVVLPIERTYYRLHYCRTPMMSGGRHGVARVQGQRSQVSEEWPSSRASLPGSRSTPQRCRDAWACPYILMGRVRPTWTGSAQSSDRVDGSKTPLIPAHRA